MGEVTNLINSSNSVVILTHEKPDGDAIGSSLALYLAWRDMGKDVDVVIPEWAKIFSYLNGLDEVITDSLREYDLAITVDCASLNRIGQVSDVFGSARKSLVIDHHISNEGYGSVNYIRECSSCSQMVFDILRMLGVTIEREIGNAIITGIITDTNGFKNSDVDNVTFDVASFLYKSGAEISRVYTELMQTKSMARFELFKMVVNRLEFLCDGKIAFSYVSKEDVSNVGAVFGDHEGLVDIGKGVEGVEVSIFLREEETYKISLRSNTDIDVSKIASSFGGGGHKKAAGCNIDLPFSEAKMAIIEEVRKYLV